jgi:2-polyprenyl-3-methyl-5-hydroxy-6-metoxy-1,4-benzoquinol methylase
MNVRQLYNKRFENSKVLARKNKIWQVLCKHFFQKQVSEDSIVLDIAAGYCEFINNIKAKEKIAFDLNPDTKRYANESVRTIEDSFFNMDIHLQGEKVDVIFASNIFEHLDIKDQVVLAVKKCVEALNSNSGKLMILQPDISMTDRFLSIIRSYRGISWFFILLLMPVIRWMPSLKSNSNREEEIYPLYFFLFLPNS